MACRIFQNFELQLFLTIFNDMVFVVISLMIGVKNVVRDFEMLVKVCYNEKII